MLQFIMFFAPAFVGTLLYEGLRPGQHSVFRLATLTMSFVLITNLCVYATIMLLGLTQLEWANEFYLSNVFFCVRYMGLSLMYAIIAAFFIAGLSLISEGFMKGFKKGAKK